MREQGDLLNDPALQDSDVIIRCKERIRRAKLEEGKTRLPGKGFWFRNLPLNE